MTEEVLIKVELPNAEENNKRIDDLTRDIIALNEETDQLRKTNEALAKAGQKNSQEYVNNAKQIEINKQKVSENTASRKGLIQTIEAEDNSIKGLRVQNAELIKQRDLINTKTKEGQAAIAKINAKLDENNEAIKANSSGLEKQKINIGNYASALDGIIPGFSGFIQGIQGATKAGLAFIATPVGAVLAAVAAAIATLTAAIKTDDETADAFGKTWDQISSIFDVVLRRVGFLGRALVELVSGNFNEAFELAGKSVSGLGDEISRAIELSGELADRQNKLDDDLNRFHARETARQNEATRLRIESRNKTLDEAAAIELINKASAIEAALTKEKTELTKRQSDIDIEAIGLKHNMQRQLNETTEQYGLRLLENTEIGGEEAEKIAEALDKINQAQSASIAFQEKLQNQRDALTERQLENEKKIYEQAKELADLQFNEQIERIRKLEEEKALIKQEATELEMENIKIEEEAKEEVYIKDWKAYSESEKQKTKIKKLEEANRLSVFSSFLGLAKGLLKENTLAYKAAGIAQATVDTFRAGNAVLAETKGGTIARIIGMITVITAGLANVAKIVGVNFAKGGILKKFAVGGIADNGGILSGPSHAQGGIPFSVGGRLGFEAEGGEAIINKRSTDLYKRELSAINQAGGGRSFALGGIPANETRIATQQAQSQFDVNQMASLMNMVQVVLVREDFEVKQMEHMQTVNRAKVI